MSASGHSSKQSLPLVCIPSTSLRSKQKPLVEPIHETAIRTNGRVLIQHTERARLARQTNKDPSRRSELRHHTFQGHRYFVDRNINGLNSCSPQENINKSKDRHPSNTSLPTILGSASDTRHCSATKTIQHSLIASKKTYTTGPFRYIRHIQKANTESSVQHCLHPCIDLTLDSNDLSKDQTILPIAESSVSTLHKCFKPSHSQTQHIYDSLHENSWCTLHCLDSYQSPIKAKLELIRLLAGSGQQSTLDSFHSDIPASSTQFK
ncbi:hypothetical protein BDV3_000247 [Batrachochytrium dendrobatidis]|uniref:Uncharacterized protein n=1 Tax=Batrachochytrium dendrobatidis (strain JEL423) TaxID=403673 RepID=A0A177WBU3_BATDL|nr:hypothetical protein O5D80_004536 [Batrachochytrium dendrobatidis]KAK5667973.1 hypothetical protein QVD99_005020 [Batrachochytrium dendrobatidis]OAJ37212.1 hypothetical protein BDEG_21264 [Batrachochytrium dendrobatidis JEL423]